MALQIRQEEPGDYPRVKNVLDLAFEQEDESRMVEKLRQLPEFIPALALVAEQDGKLVGCIYYSISWVESPSGRVEMLCLAPVAVLPEYQNAGIGSVLIRKSLERARELGYSAVNVLGHSDYYPRFGFERASKWEIQPAFEVPEEAFMVLALRPGALAGVTGQVIYSEAFGL